MNPKDKYKLSEWAQLFVLATIEDITIRTVKVREWVCQHSDDNGLPQPSGNDVKYLIEEALQFLEKFSENHIDNMYNR
jgi:hypothetical protein